MPTDLIDLAERASQGRLRRLVVNPGARRQVAALADELATAGERVLLTDGVPKSVAGVDLDSSVAAQTGCTRTVVARDAGHGVVLDEETVTAAAADVGRAGLVVCIGSGTVTDLAKVVSQECGAPVLAVQSAASVNGFADPLSVLVIKGAKRTKPSAWTSGLIIDQEIIQESPQRLTRSGVGDAIAIWSAPADWYLSCVLGMGGEFAYDVVGPVLSAAEGLTDPDEAKAFAALIEALTVGGLVIGVANSTAPLSGCDHLVSHVLDMAAMANHLEHDLHGAQVGVATVVCTALWQIALEDPTLLSPRTSELEYPDDLDERVLTTWAPIDPTGALGEECRLAVSRKRELWAKARRAEFDADFAAHVEQLRALVQTPERSAATLAHWGAATRFSELTPPVDEKLARWALAALPFMRDRLTLADLIVMAGRWDDALIDNILQRAASAGGGL